MSRTRRKNNVNTSRSFVTRVPATETAKRIALAGAVSAALGIGLTVRRVEVEGESMLPALESGDRLLVLRGCRVRAGDVAVVRDPRDPARLVVKRVASVPNPRPQQSVSPITMPNSAVPCGVSTLCSPLVPIGRWVERS